MSWDYAGDRLYIGYLNRDQEPLLPPPYNDSPGWIRVYNTINGQFEGRLLPSPEVLYGAGGLDIYHAISAFQLSNGDHVITREEDWKNKAILFVYKPETTTPEEPTPTPTSTLKLQLQLSFEAAAISKQSDLEFLERRPSSVRFFAESSP